MQLTQKRLTGAVVPYLRETLPVVMMLRAPAKKSFVVNVPVSCQDKSRKTSLEPGPKHVLSPRSKNQGYF